jgi:hypothetical protein
VKYAQEERQRNIWHIRIEIEQFDGYLKEQKLAIVRSACPPHGKTFSQWIEWAIENKCATDEDLLDIAAEYVRNPRTTTTHAPSKYDGYSWFLEREDMEALWKPMPKTPSRTALELVMHLPDEVLE